MLDPLWSTEAVEIVHDGCGQTRVEKIKYISQNETVMKNLRYCWENRDVEYNCGKCEKCLRTATCLEIAGVRERTAQEKELVVKLHIKDYLKPVWQEIEEDKGRKII